MAGRVPEPFHWPCKDDREMTMSGSFLLHVCSFHIVFDASGITDLYEGNVFYILMYYGFSCENESLND
jgi:hypothetical protein